VLQIALALLVLRWPAGRAAFEAVGGLIRKLLEFSSDGASFVFGRLADVGEMEESVRREKRGSSSPSVALPTIVFVSSLFAVLYHLGVLQLVVRAFAVGMRYLMGTSGPETLSVTANVFLGQTEAPLLVRPYVPGMTRSELLALMVGGMAHVSGSMMAVYVGMGADAVAILVTSVMASPCTLYLTKIVMPETQAPAATPPPPAADEEKPANVIDAAAAGASAGMRLAPQHRGHAHRLPGLHRDGQRVTGFHRYGVGSAELVVAGRLGAARSALDGVARRPPVFPAGLSDGGRSQRDERGSARCWASSWWPTSSSRTWNSAR